MGSLNARTCYKFLFNKKFNDSTLAKRHIVVGHFVRSDTGHVMQAIDVTRHSRVTQQLVPSTTLLSFVCCSQFACKKKVAHDFRYDPRRLQIESDRSFMAPVCADSLLKARSKTGEEG